MNFAFASPPQFIQDGQRVLQERERDSKDTIPGRFYKKAVAGKRQCRRRALTLPGLAEDQKLIATTIFSLSDIRSFTGIGVKKLTGPRGKVIPPFIETNTQPVWSTVS